jgi:hypothetical protein
MINMESSEYITVLPVCKEEKQKRQASYIQGILSNESLRIHNPGRDRKHRLSMANQHTLTELLPAPLPGYPQ